MLPGGRSRVRFPMRSLFSGPSSFNRSMTMESTQHLIEMSTKNFPGDKGRPAPKANNITAVSRLSSKCGEPRRLATLLSSTACYRESFTSVV
jgi:hypothetical protein